MSIAKVKTLYAIVAFFLITWVLSGCNIITLDNNIPDITLEEKVVDLYNKITITMSAMNNLANWVLAAIIFSLIGFLVLVIYFRSGSTKLNKTLTQELVTTQIKIKQLSEELWKVQEKNNLLHEENLQIKDTIKLVTEILYETAPAKYKKFIDMTHTRPQLRTSRNKDEVDSFVDELIRTYKDEGGSGYIPLKTLRQSLGYSKNFESLLQESRKRYPSLIRLETNNHGQTLLKITEGG